MTGYKKISRSFPSAFPDQNARVHRTHFLALIIYGIDASPKIKGKCWRGKYSKCFNKAFDPCVRVVSANQGDQKLDGGYKLLKMRWMVHRSLIKFPAWEASVLTARRWGHIIHNGLEGVNFPLSDLCQACANWKLYSSLFLKFFLQDNFIVINNKFFSSIPRQPTF